MLQIFCFLRRTSNFEDTRQPAKRTEKKICMKNTEPTARADFVTAQACTPTITTFTGEVKTTGKRAVLNSAAAATSVVSSHSSVLAPGVCMEVVADPIDHGLPSSVNSPLGQLPIDTGQCLDPAMGQQCPTSSRPSRQCRQRHRCSSLRSRQGMHTYSLCLHLTHRWRATKSEQRRKLQQAISRC